MSLIDNTLRDPDIVAFIQGQAEVMAQAQAEADDRSAEIAALQEAGGVRNIRKAKRLKVELNALKSKIALAQDNIRRALDIEAERDRLMGEGRDTLIRAKIQGVEVEVQEVEQAEFALNEYGGRIIRDDGMPALVFGLGARLLKLTGIQHAYAKGHLKHPKAQWGGEALLEIGKEYAKKFAAADPLKAVDWSQVGGAGFGPRGPQQAACEAREWLVIARGGGKGGVPLTPKQRHMVDAVCGEGCNVWQAAQKAKPKAISVPAAARALRGGLAQVAANIAAAREAKALVSGARIRAGREMDEAVRMAG